MVSKIRHKEFDVMKIKALILLAFMGIFGLGQPALADHNDKRGYHHSRQHHSQGHRVKHRFHRKHARSYRHYRAPRYVRHHYYDHGYRHHRYYRSRHHHRVDPLVAGVVLGTLVYALHH